MADNVVLNQPTTTGATIATEDVSGVQHQKVKVEFGADGVATMVDTGTPLPVTDAAAEASLASILAKIIAAPSTEAKQDALNSLITTLNSIVATSAKQDTGNNNTGLLATTIEADTVTSKPGFLGIGYNAAGDRYYAIRTDASGNLQTNVIGSVLPSGAAIAANQQTDALTQAQLLTELDEKFGDLGQKAMAGSAPVVIASDQSAVPISGTIAVSSLPAGLATSGNQTTEIAGLASIDSKVTNVSNLDVLLSTRTKPADQQHTVVDSGTLTAVTAITNALPAGSNVIGKTGIDQTTPGTTNLVALTAETTKVIGVTRTSDGSGNLLSSTGNALDVNIKTPATLPVSIADGINVVEGAIADAIVAAGASGTVSAKLRRVTQGLEDLKTTIVLAAGTNLIGKIGIDQTTPGTTNKVSIGTDGIINLPQVDGKWQQEIMLQILIELRMLNQMFYELPLTLQGKTRKFDELVLVRSEQNGFME